MAPEFCQFGNIAYFRLIIYEPKYYIWLYRLKKINIQYPPQVSGHSRFSLQFLWETVPRAKRSSVPIIIARILLKHSIKR